MERTEVQMTGATDLVVYCPGNGTRYEVAFTDWDGGDTFSMAVLNFNGVAGTLNTFGFLSLGYFQEKTGLKNKADCAALLALISERYGREVQMPPDFNDLGLWDAALANANAK